MHPLTATGLPEGSSPKELRERQEGEVLCAEFAISCMDALVECVRAVGADIVLSSDWRRTAARREAVDRQLRSHGLPASVGITPEDGAGRAAEILKWVAQRASSTCWVAVDDQPLGNYLPDRHFVQVDPRTGFTSANADRVIELLRLQGEDALGLANILPRRRRGGGARSMLRLSAFYRVPTGGAVEDSI